MKVHRAALFLCLSGVCLLTDYPAYGAPLKADNEQMELYLEKLQVNILEEEKAVESLKKRYEDILRKKQNPEEQKVKKENKGLSAPQSKKIATEGQRKAVKEEHPGWSARDTVQPEPRPDKKGPPAGRAGNEKREKEIKENSFSGKSIDSKNSGNDQASCFDLSRENKPGILRGFLDKAKKLDSWWQEKVW